MLSCVADYRIAARKRLPRLAFDYLDGGAEDGDALRRNAEAYRQWLFKPRVLTDVSCCSSATQFFGREAAAPLIVGPTGLNGLFWPRADELLAHAASEAGLPFVLSTASTSLLEDVRAAAPRGDLWMQLYVQQDRGIAEDLMRRASAAGFSTLVLTVDVPVHGKRDHDTRNGFALPLRLSPRLIADCMRHPHWCWQMARHGSPQLKNIARSVGERADLSRHAAMLSRQMDLTLGWTDLEWVRRHWSGKLIVKGIQGRDDALLALAHGADGIVLSNHGGRQLGSTFAPLELLPAIAEAVGNRLDVFVDGGVRRGSDALKAVSLGARGVLLGRAPLYGLASRGGAGVREVLALMLQEMHIAMRLLGCSALDQLQPGMVERAA
ncbi:alpha-hydroxy acid oxidase [Paraburkholderia fungorum]|uniref:(S)-mandelate dehydrogenase n=1 Tax=Paraburkholderia fungorum TaxID=134537 RepID=A0AAW3UUL9_9BURK|nr:alpha-hydroxy acid oxidase [Paraburkholderia fungorum]MBB4514364.1 (S)-mandelate dehydrogenase [Paraburkholderia fungorum]MBB6202094.1 (S)-mandelate dehydrogenase [Paraburkholderia fungorum]